MRLLISLTMLVAMGGCEPQVKLHVAANLRVGNDRARLIDVLTQLLPYIGYPRMLNALRSLNEALETGGKVLIPAFAVGRTQTLIYVIARLQEEGKLPKSLPVFVEIDEGRDAGSAPKP
jgi:hypothetical protein